MRARSGWTASDLTVSLSADGVRGPAVGTLTGGEASRSCSDPVGPSGGPPGHDDHSIRLCVEVLHSVTCQNDCVDTRVRAPESHYLAEFVPVCQQFVCSSIMKSRPCYRQVLGARQKG